MFEYKTKWHDESNSVWLVMNEEKDGWEFMQVVPSSSKSGGYEYWFRQPLYPKTPIKPSVSRQRITC